MPQDKPRPSSPEPAPRSEDPTRPRDKDDPSYAPESGEKPEVMHDGDSRRAPASPQR